MTKWRFKAEVDLANTPPDPGNENACEHGHLVADCEDCNIEWQAFLAPPSKKEGRSA